MYGVKPNLICLLLLCAFLPSAASLFFRLPSPSLLKYERGVSLTTICTPRGTEPQSRSCHRELVTEKTGKGKLLNTTNHKPIRESENHLRPQEDNYSMDVPGIRGHMGTEKYQMLELNKRLETYLGRVKFLEEENKLLHGEVEALRQSKNQRAWKGQLEAELRKTREEVEAALREKDRVELEVSSLNEELQMLEQQMNKVAVARVETKKTVDESKKQLEEEHRAQIWLREKLVQLEKELQFHMEVHQEDISFLQTKLIHTHIPPHAYVQPQLLDLEDIKHEFSQRASRAWQEAAGSF